MIARRLEEARRREPAWDASRHDRVRTSLNTRVAKRDRRRRTMSFAGSSLLGAALLVLGMRAFASTGDAPASSELHSSSSSSTAGPRIANDDAGLRADVMRD